MLYVLNAASIIMKPQPSLCYSVAIDTCSMEQIASLYSAVLHSVSFLVTILLCLRRKKQLLALLRPAYKNCSPQSFSRTTYWESRQLYYIFFAFRLRYHLLQISVWNYSNKAMVVISLFWYSWQKHT